MLVEDPDVLTVTELKVVLLAYQGLARQAMVKPKTTAARARQQQCSLDVRNINVSLQHGVRLGRCGTREFMESICASSEVGVQATPRGDPV